MTKKEREILCEVVKNVKMPDGYASNISRCVNIKERKISGLKTHDSHILFEYILPLALRVCGPSQQVTSIAIELDVILDDKSLMQAHRYVLRHYDEIEHFRQNIMHCREFVAIERRKCRRHVHLDSNAFNKLINEKFHDWFRNKVMTMDGTSVSNDIVSLGIGPNKVAKRFSGFIINGIRFHTSAREEQRLTQNSGVVNISEVGGVNYYGRIQDIIELNYYGAFKVVMFKCDWFDVHHNMGVKQDEYGFTLLNFSRLIHTGEKVDDDPYVFSSQVEQVFYVQDPKNTNWHAVVKVKSRDSFDVVNDEVLTDENFIVPISGDISNVDDHPNWKMSSINTANAKKQKCTYYGKSCALIERSERSGTDLAQLHEQIFEELMGPEHNGRVRGMGLGPTPSSYFGVTTQNVGSRWEFTISGNQLKEIEELKGKLQTVNNDYAQLKEVGDNASEGDQRSPNNHSSHSSHEPSQDNY
ncbi:hypothetical protein GH714_002801 [Hevea brasiliensis]|uniref:DUF4216 domain-containing protein n=1 Tax=Hevea brasiliensis TaxID=3981 RepID=A0A6A6NFE9_HEVBR|nr:hypothetical protein GH714_002801 [Hevea brasiliensis]